jgi:mannose-1-phosphate guanylyltransferase
MLQAVILAGGLGTRLRPLTLSVPKPLVPVAGRPFLHHQLALLASHGVRTVLILTGYLGSQIEASVGDGSGFGLEVTYSQEPAPLGTGGALRLAARHLQDRFLLVLGDTYLRCDYRGLVERHDPKRESGRIVAYTNPEGTFRNNLSLAADGRVLRYDKRDPEAATHVDAGIAVFEKDILDLLPPAEVCSLEEEAYPRLVAAGRLYGEPTGERFYDIGSFAELQTAERLLR